MSVTRSPESWRSSCGIVKKMVVERVLLRLRLRGGLLDRLRARGRLPVGSGVCTSCSTGAESRGSRVPSGGLAVPPHPLYDVDSVLLVRHPHRPEVQDVAHVLTNLDNIPLNADM
jgi:hypothetical protein